MFILPSALSILEAALHRHYCLPFWGPYIFITSLRIPEKWSESEVAQSCPTLCDPMDCSLPGSSICGILQARVLEWVAVSTTHFVVSLQFSSVTQSCPTLRPHESQHTRPPCPSPTPRVHSNSPPSSRWCHPPVSSSVIPFSSCPQSLPASESFPMSQLFAWGGQNTKVSALASFLPKNTQGWSPLEWTGWISLLKFKFPSVELFGVYSSEICFHY